MVFAANVSPQGRRLTGPLLRTRWNTSGQPSESRQRCLALLGFLCPLGFLHGMIHAKIEKDSVVAICFGKFFVHRTFFCIKKMGIRATKTTKLMLNTEISFLLNSPKHLGNSHSSSSSWFATSLAASSWAAFSFAFFLSAFLWMICVDILSRCASSLIQNRRDFQNSNKNHPKTGVFHEWHLIKEMFNVVKREKHRNIIDVSMVNRHQVRRLWSQSNKPYRF